MATSERNDAFDTLKSWYDELRQLAPGEQRLLAGFEGLGHVHVEAGLGFVDVGAGAGAVASVPRRP